MEILKEVFKDIPYALREIIGKNTIKEEYDIYMYPSDIKKVEQNLKKLDYKVYKIHKFLTPKNQYHYFIELENRYILLDLHAYLPLHRKVWLADFIALDEIIKNRELKNGIYWINKDDFNVLKLVKETIYLKFPKNNKHKKILEENILKLYKDYKYRDLIKYLPISEGILLSIIQRIKENKDYDDLLKQIKKSFLFNLKLKWFFIKKRFIFPFFTKPKWLSSNNCNNIQLLDGFNIIFTNKKDIKYFIRGFSGISILCNKNDNFNNLLDEIKDKYMKELK